MQHDRRDIHDDLVKRLIDEHEDPLARRYAEAEAEAYAEAYAEADADADPFVSSVLCYSFCGLPA